MKIENIKFSLSLYIYIWIYIFLTLKSIAGYQKNNKNNQFHNWSIFFYFALFLIDTSCSGVSVCFEYY